MKKFNVIQKYAVVRYWNDVEAEDAELGTIYANVPPDKERVIESETDVYED